MQVSRIETSDAPWPVMVLAYNEERKIVECLDSIYAADPTRQFEIFVMANGCTDRTEDIVREYGRKHKGVHLVSIKMPDYCNAWNVFIHETAAQHLPDSQIYFFLDGDCRVHPGSMSEMARALAAHETAHAAGSIPVSGHNRDHDAKIMLEGRTFVANLYALKGDFVRRLQQKSVRLPVGLEGDDGLIGALVKWDLDPRSNEFDNQRVVTCAKAGFDFDPVSRTSYRALRTYWRRLIRYGRRRYEFQLLGPILKEKGLAGIPKHISEIYGEAKHLKLRWQGYRTIPNLIALRQMRKQAS